MAWKVHEVKEFLENQHNEDIVEFGHYCQSRDNPLYFEQFSLRTRRPKRTEFEHTECRFCESIQLKGNERLYCNREEDIIDKYSDGSCDEFEHKDYKDLEYDE